MEKIRLKVTSVICETFSVTKDEFNDLTGPGNLVKWDSIGQLRLIMQLEKAFDVQLSVDNVMSINNVGDIIDIISNLLGGENLQSQKSTTFSNEINEKTIYHPLRMPSQTFWGIDSITMLKTIIEGRVVIVTGSSEYSSKIQKKISNILGGQADKKFIQRPLGEPDNISCQDVAEQFKEIEPEYIIAIGGGSTIDVTKIARLLYENPSIELSAINGILDNFDIKKETKLLAVPTTFGTGSEVSSAAAFSIAGNVGKTILVSHDLLPQKVFLDPSLGYNVGRNILFPSAIDALTHAIEGFVSIIKHPLLDPIACQAVKEILTALRHIIDKNNHEEAIEKLCYSAYYAGIVQNHCSVGLTHSFAHQLSSLGINHGTANAIFLESVMEYNSNRIDLYEKLSFLCGFKSFEDFMLKIRTIIEDSGILPEKKILEKIKEEKNAIVHGAMEDITFRTNPVQLSQSDVETIFDNTIKNHYK